MLSNKEFKYFNIYFLPNSLWVKSYNLGCKAIEGLVYGKGEIIHHNWSYTEYVDLIFESFTGKRKTYKYQLENLRPISHSGRSIQPVSKSRN